MVCFGLAVVVTLGLHAYLWYRLVRSTARPGSRWRRIGGAIVALLAIGLVVSVVTRGEPRLFAWAEYLWLALMFYLFVALLVLELPRLAVAWWLRRRARAAPAAPTTAEAAVPAEGADTDTDADADRRLFLARSVAIVAGLTAVGATGYGMTQALGAPVVERVPIPLRRLGRPLDGYRIALISDVHL